MRFYQGLSIVTVGLICSLAVEAADKKADQPTWTDPAKAAAEDPDFVLQGEYGVAKLEQDWAFQVVALGGGKFDAYLLEGGFPGLGFTREKQRIHFSGARDDSGVVSLVEKGGKRKAKIKDGTLTLEEEGKTLSFPRVERRSPTLGKPAPAGAIVLFDGTSADAWEKGNIVDGLLANNGPKTKQLFSAYHLHLEFRVPYKPFSRGQGRGNSGVYHVARYETQVLDAFGLEGKMNETGGLYSIKDPDLNMCLPPLTWQTYDVDLTAPIFSDEGELLVPARITVLLNGVLIHDNIALPKCTPASPIKTITPDPGPIYLQAHGNPVFYRNIWLIEK